MPDSNTPHKQRKAFVSFATTQWTKVLSAQGDSEEARGALADLCERYYQPVHSFILRKIGDPEQAKDLTQGFFAHTLEHSPFDKLEPQRAKFRTYLLGAVKHFLNNQRRKAQRQKRGGGKSHERLTQLDHEPAATTDSLTDESTFDYEWALHLIGSVLSQVETDYQQRQQTAQFEVLKPWLIGQPETLTQSDAARQLSMSEGAVKVAIHRLRHRFRDRTKTAIAQTLGPEETVESELNYLLQVLSQRP